MENSKPNNRTGCRVLVWRLHSLLLKQSQHINQEAIAWYGGDYTSTMFISRILFLPVFWAHKSHVISYHFFLHKDPPLAGFMEGRLLTQPIQNTCSSSSIQSLQCISLIAA